ncbi:hypothetical protein HKD37_06G014864 [Glycine soja]
MAVKFQHTKKNTKHQSTTSSSPPLSLPQPSSNRRHHCQSRRSFASLLQSSDLHMFSALRANAATTPLWPQQRHRRRNHRSIPGNPPLTITSHYRAATTSLALFLGSGS